MVAAASRRRRPERQKVVIGMLSEETNASTRARLLRLTPSGDLLDLARQMRDMGVESLLFCAPSGRIAQVVTDRQIAHLAAHPDPVPATVGGSPADPTAVESPVDGGLLRPDVSIPRQEVPIQVDYSAPVV